MKLVSVEEMLAIEKEADKSGLSYAQMMENAGLGLAEEISGFSYSHGGERIILGLVGPGNNGGDALVALAKLAEEGWEVTAYLVKRNKDDDPLVERVLQAGGNVFEVDKDKQYKELKSLISSASILLDGLLGTGIKLPLKAEIAKVLSVTGSTVKDMDWPPFIIAVDCPTGVDIDSGETAPETLRADLTVTMAAVKRGLLSLPAFDYLGELHVVDIGLTEKNKSWKKVQSFVANEEDVRSILPDRPSDAHKGTFGTAMVVAGSINYTGAALLAGQAAYRSGVGLVTMAVPGSLHTALAGHFPEATWLLLPHEIGVIAAGAADVLVEHLENTTALLVGPGFGLENTTGEFLENLLHGKVTMKKISAGRLGFVQRPGTEEEDVPAIKLPAMVLDADGLKLLAKIEGWSKLIPTPAVLTPHPGEMAVLTGLPKDDIQADRLSIAIKYAQEWGHVVVLKGAFSVVAAPDGRSTTIPVATAALARAGTGDVLAGLIAGFMAQGVDAYEAAVAGAYIHATAGLYAKDEVGSTASVLAGDVLAAVNDVISDLSG